MRQTAKAALVFLPLAALARAQALPGWTLTFSDEFNASELEFPKWSVHDPWLHARNSESQAWVPSAVQLHDGQLHIAARKEPARYDGQLRGYTSGIVTTYGSFAQTYGRFEIRCRLPAGQGFQPKFWLLPVPSGEIPSIDVISTVGNPVPVVTEFPSALTLTPRLPGQKSILGMYPPAAEATPPATA